MMSLSNLKIVIVGGVAGGMSAATRARRLGETALITVLEKGPHISFANCGLPYALGPVITDRNALLLHTPTTVKHRFDIDVKTDTEVTNIDRRNHTVDVLDLRTKTVRQVPYDKLVLAMGAEPYVPRIEGLDSPKVFSLHTIPDLDQIREFIRNTSPKRAVVIGGGFIGLEAAENIHQLGLHVSIVERESQVFATVDSDIAARLHNEIRRNGVSLFLNASVKSITRSGATILNDGTSIPADLVLIVVGSRPRTELARKAGLELNSLADGIAVNACMQTSDPNIYAIGDAAATHHRISLTTSPLLLAGPANRQGRLAADHIFGRRSIYKGNVGTHICKVFDLVVGGVGLSVRSLKALGRNYQYITVHQPHHSRYYPGAENITVRLVFEKMTGKILGAQAVGKAGVDKRVDVLATAMQADMTVFDLEELELGYSPPFGAAKDAVNMAGFVAGNVMRGDVEIVHPEDIGIGETVFVDVRSQQEFEKGHVNNAINIPVDDLRARVGELRSSQRTVVYCQVGYRGYLAHRILKQHGFNSVMNLDGGFKEVMERGYSQLVSE